VEYSANFAGYRCDKRREQVLATFGDVAPCQCNQWG